MALWITKPATLTGYSVGEIAFPDTSILIRLDAVTSL